MGFKVVALVGGVATGIVVGAIGMEVLKKTNPDMVKNMEKKIKNAGQAIKDAFEGREAIEEA